jgi:hypothetical protein
VDAYLPGDAMMTWIVSSASLLAVWVPFYRAFKLCLQAWRATRLMAPAELSKAAESTQPAVEPMAMLMMRTLQKALRENEDHGHPTDFIYDATRQYVVNEYDTHYTTLVSMYAGLLPPIGFIGTTGGMLILFLSMHFANSSLELGALAVALTSSIFALMAYAVLEGLKIRLYGRLLESLDVVHALYADADARREAKKRASAA